MDGKSMGVLNKSVLILNKNWIAIRVKNVRTAILLASRERACIVDPVDYSVYTWDEWVKLKAKEDDKYISSAKCNIKMPEVIVLTQYGKVPDYDVRLTKKNICIRDSYNCQYTGEKVDRKDADIDHIIPKSKGGTSSWDNLVYTSKKLNRKKADKSLEEAGLKLVKKPKKPKARSLLLNSVRTMPDSWKKFI
jgi:5-methylcytosine-specific restriction endonuclease McrA